jgi:hypothetical protein
MEVTFIVVEKGKRSVIEQGRRMLVFAFVDINPFNNPLYKDSVRTAL